MPPATARAGGIVASGDVRSTAMNRLWGTLVVLLVLLAACGGGGGDKPNRLSADKVVKAFEDAGLQVPNPRDNTKSNCGSLKCEKLVTTDAFSIYEWSDADAAQRWAKASGPSATAHRNVTLRFATGGTAPEVDPAPYEKVLKNL